MSLPHKKGSWSCVVAEEKVLFAQLFWKHLITQQSWGSGISFFGHCRAKGHPWRKFPFRGLWLCPELAKPEALLAPHLLSYKIIESLLFKHTELRFSVTQAERILLYLGQNKNKLQTSHSSSKKCTGSHFCVTFPLTQGFQHQYRQHLSLLPGRERLSELEAEINGPGALAKRL